MVHFPKLGQDQRRGSQGLQLSCLQFRLYNMFSNVLIPIINIKPEMVTKLSIQWRLTMESSVPTMSASTIVIVKLPSKEVDELAGVTATVG